MSLTVTPGDPRDPAATALLQASHTLMQELFPPEDNHYLSIDALCGPGIRFFTATRDGRTLGCAALALRDDYGEIKSMFVAPEARGTGAADALMQALEAEARANTLPLLRLETGDSLHAAHRLYARHGFTECGPFGDYAPGGSSLFMEKPLA
ncbi:GNAT family N-acetyltransferase [Pseudoruegeria sp. HB172150]|uniref:GNAT family N-acetyltransferase n=1 Tax=Pseudoruegeria sp. HB172150 TaxID=2721164 RepID=UPI001556466D|nr:GNAT family N-acetyltransferase [Pseudoruegeria sp. HB172150]